MFDSFFPDYGSGCVVKVAKKMGNHFCIHTYVEGNRTFFPTTERMMEDTLFDIASLTKTVTAILIHQAVERGCFSYRDTIASLDSRFMNLTDVTVLNLLTHQVEVWTDGYLKDASSKEAFDRILFSSFVKERRPCYTDVHYMILSKVLETCYQMDYGTIVAEKICAPLHLSDTTFTPSLDRLASCSRELMEDPSQTLPHDPKARLAYQFGFHLGHAGLFTTASDYLKILVSLIDGKEILLKQKTTQFFFSHGDYEAYLKEELSHLGIDCKHDLRSYFQEANVNELLQNFMKPYSYGGMRYKIDLPLLDPIPFPVSVHSYLFSGYTGPIYLIDRDREMIFLMMINSCYGSLKTRQERLKAILKMMERLYQMEVNLDEKG